MNALLEPYDFSLLMSDLTTLTVRMAADLKRELEDRAREVHFSVDELVEQMVRAALFRNSPDYHDPHNERAQHLRRVEEGLRDIHLGNTVSLEEVMRTIDDQLGAEKTQGFPTKP